eukprot:365604-Chlamydomonas_euryale.AAC.12
MTAPNSSLCCGVCARQPSLPNSPSHTRACHCITPTGSCTNDEYLGSYMRPRTHRRSRSSPCCSLSAARPRARPSLPASLITLIAISVLMWRICSSAGYTMPARRCETCVEDGPYEQLVDTRRSSKPANPDYKRPEGTSPAECESPVRPSPTRAL